MRAALISVSADGVALSERISEALNDVECSVYKFDKKGGNITVGRFSDIGELTAKIFGEYDALIFVCACGIAVRAIAPHIRSKVTDPAVIVIDDCGKFAIPLLSGHIGGANALAKRIAELIGAVPVITTATDNRGKFSPDLFAKANNLILDDLEGAKEVAAAVLRGDSLAVVSNFEIINLTEDFWEHGALAATLNIDQLPQSCSGEFIPKLQLHFLARNIVLGIGCKRGIPADVIEHRVMAAFGYMGYDFRQVIEIATIDLKRDEQGLLEFAKRHGLPVRFFTAEELMSVPAEPNNLKGSGFVMKITGADNVSERAAILAADGGRILIPKSYPNCTGDGVTVAAAAKPLVIDFAKTCE